ncbi:12843_t:CDS:2, partial [Entrophospora sp. SA101]
PLPNFGRSRGLHSYVENWQSLIEATHLVNHVREQNLAESINDETFDSFVVMAPLIYIDDKGSPSKLIENIAKILVKTSFEHLSFAKAYRGKSSN